MLTRRLRVLLTAAVLVVAPIAPLTLSAPAAHAGVTCSPPYQPDPSDQYCTVYVGTPGGPGTGGSTHGGGSNDCGNVPGDEIYTLPGYTFVPCYDPTWGWWDAADRCWVTQSTPQPVPGFRAASQAQDPAWYPNWSGWSPDWYPSLIPPPYKEGDGVVYSGHCYVHAGHGDWVDFPVWFPSVTTPPTIPQLLAQAQAKIHMTGAQIEIAPKPGGMGLVGLPVWLATAVTPQTWGPQPVTVGAGGLTLTAVATGQQITWDMGDGSPPIVCKAGQGAPGTAYKPGLPDSARTCGYTYTKSSGAQPGGVYKVTATTLWQIAWNTNTGANGVVTPAPTTTATTTVSIGELQVVQSPGG